MGAAGLEIELADQGATKPDSDSVFEDLQLDVFPNEGAADEIALPLHAHAAVFPHLANMRRIRILPQFVVLLENTRARLPTPCRHIHL
jgi:hypothetical protein